jgi:hypothetical protein
MLDQWEVPRIEHIRAVERRRFASVPVVGLSGQVYQDLGRGALEVEIIGSLSSDEARDAFVTELRQRYAAGTPVDFVADITKDSELEQVVVTSFVLEEVAGRPDWFRYRITLTEHTEPPEPPGPDFGFEPDLGLDVELGLDLLDLPGLLAAVPPLDDMLAPVEESAKALSDTLGRAGELLSPLSDLLGDE